MNVVDEFRRADWEEQVRMLRDREIAAEIEGWLGSPAFKDLCGLVDGTHLSTGSRNLIVVPGVMGSMLQSSGEGGIWWLDMLRARDKLNGLALAPDGHNDLRGGAAIEPCAIDITYAPMRVGIAQSGEFGGSVQFPYDWRKPLESSADALRKSIHQVHSDYGEAVHLVGHSMGGLMIRTTLMKYGEELWPKIGKIVFIGTPHYGATSIAGYLKNHLWGWEQLAVLGAFLSREAFRSLWGVISLLPAPAGIYPDTRHGQPHPCANFDLYDATAYRLDLDAASTADLQRALDAAGRFHTELFDWHIDGLTPAQRGRMLQISGVGRKTLFRLEIQSGWLGAWEDVEKITSRTPGDAHRDGDGRVPVASADLEKIQVRYVKGEHGSLQNIPAVIDDVVAWLTDKPLRLPETPQGALGTHLSNTLSRTPDLDGSTAFSGYDDEYDRYHDVPESRVRELVAQMEKSGLPGIDFVRIL